MRSAQAGYLWCWLLLLPAEIVSAATVGETNVSPSVVQTGVATLVTVTSVITDPTLIPGGASLQRLNSSGAVMATLGTLRDDGTAGDAVANDGTYTARVTILESAPSTITLRVSAAFRGTLRRVFSAPLSVIVTDQPPLDLTIQSPSNGAYLSTSVVDVTGTVNGAGAQVTVNGIHATVSGSGYTASVSLVEGINTLTAVATNAGLTSTVSIAVTLDTIPPEIAITTPSDGAVFDAAAITVVGTVSDAAAVVVNGVRAAVTDGEFVVLVPIALGFNTIQAVAVDRAGNAGTASVSVQRVAQL